MAVGTVATGGSQQDRQIRGGAAPVVLYVRDTITRPTPLGAALQAWGFQVIERVTGTDAALEWAREHAPDLIIIESRVTGCSELVRRVVRDPSTRACPVFQLEPLPPAAGPVRHPTSGAVMLSSASVPEQWFTALVHALAEPVDSAEIAAQRRRIRERLPRVSSPSLRARTDRRRPGVTQ